MTFVSEDRSTMQWVSCMAGRHKRRLSIPVCLSCQQGIVVLTFMQVYKGIVELCMIKYRDSEGLYVGLPEAAFCTARSQLLMNLHDAGVAEICKQVCSGPSRYGRRCLG